MKTVFQKREQGGFTLLEFAVVVLVSAIVSVVALNRFEHYREQAEITAARQVVAALRTSLEVRAGPAAARRRQPDQSAVMEAGELSGRVLRA
jgi:prepilin-type N-terminal cleavage/methylation domain-containing protein